MFDARYDHQVRLVVHCLQFLSDHRAFALKGGTAINFFAESMPRLSVDIDLTYLPLNARGDALAAIDKGLLELKREILAGTANSSIKEQRAGGHLVRLYLSTPAANIKIEPNLIFRGSVYPPSERELTAEAQHAYQATARVQVLDRADLYAGKLCAALDRQHPRDLYDVKRLLDGSGITPNIRRAFVVYLAGHNRPMNELLQPRQKDIRLLHSTQFIGMTREEISLEELVAVQSRLPILLRESLDENERVFLLSLKQGNPDWDRLGIAHVSQLPALQWKLINIRRMKREKHREALSKLERVLFPA